MGVSPTESITRVTSSESATTTRVVGTSSKKISNSSTSSVISVISASREETKAPEKFAQLNTSASTSRATPKETINQGTSISPDKSISTGVQIEIELIDSSTWRATSINMLTSMRMQQTTKQTEINILVPEESTMVIKLEKEKYKFAVDASLLEGTLEEEKLIGKIKVSIQF